MTVMPAPTTRSTSSRGVQRPSEAVVCMWRSVIRRNACGRAALTARSPRAGADGGRRRGSCPAALATLSLHERAILANEEIEMVAFFVGELEEDLFAFRILE